MEEPRESFFPKLFELPKVCLSPVPPLIQPMNTATLPLICINTGGTGLLPDKQEFYLCQAKVSDLSEEIKMVAIYQ